MIQNYNDRIILAAERRALVPYSDMHIWRLEKSNKFPKRIKLGPHRVGWSLQEVNDWIDVKKAERDLGVCQSNRVVTTPLPKETEL
jgi:prophage regulatory protein